MSVTIYGASDDLIVIDGDIRAEWTALEPDEGKTHIGLSNGALVSIVYDDGCWVVRPVWMEGVTYTVEPHEGIDSDNYSDRLTVEGDIYWAALSYAVER